MAASPFQYIISLLLGYCIGSFPTAYLLVKRKAGLDIRTQGSGNVGAMNTYDVTGSKALGVAVLLIDLIKGVVAVFCVSLLIGSDYWIMGSGGIGAIIGHNYTPWLKFKGGRGLATAAGVMLMLGWVFVVVWITMWVIIYLSSKNIHMGNILSSFGSPVVVFMIPEKFLAALIAPSPVNSFLYLSIIVCTLILIRHYDVMPDLLKSFHKPTS